MKKMLVGTMLAAVVVLAGSVSAQVTLKSPAKVKTALGSLNRVVDHTGRLINAKNYAQIPHENGEFKEGSEALEKSIAGESGDFKGQVEPLIKQAKSDAQSVSDASESKDDAKLAKSHEMLASSVKKLLAAFPADVQPGSPSRTKEKTEEMSR